jgi:hypothetical protein
MPDSLARGAALRGLDDTILTEITSAKIAQFVPIALDEKARYEGEATVAPTPKWSP